MGGKWSWEFRGEEDKEVGKERVWRTRKGDKGG
jgi:hypothetical protein